MKHLKMAMPFTPRRRGAAPIVATAVTPEGLEPAAAVTCRISVSTAREILAQAGLSAGEIDALV